MPIPELSSVTQIVNDDGLLVDVPHLKTFESRGRTSHVHWDGCEVQRQFYVKHYWAAPDVCGALLGFVLQETLPGQPGPSFVRYLPAFDPIYKEILYCNEARWDHVDKHSISAAAPLNAISGNVPDWGAYEHFMKQVNAVGEHKVEANDQGLITEGVPGGAFITASYRPLISAYHPFRYSNVLTPADRARQFDFMDPIITPGLSTIAWPDGLALITTNLRGERDHDTLNDVSDTIRVPVQELTIRRMFLGRVPYEVLDPLLGKVNHLPWPPEELNVATPWSYRGIPQYVSETLRFEDYKVTSHWSQFSNCNQWFEVELYFSARRLYSDDVYGIGGTRLGKAWVTWNHILANPALIQNHTGWYRVIKLNDLNVNAFTPLYEEADFELLFAGVDP